MHKLCVVCPMAPKYAVVEVRMFVLQANNFRSAGTMPIAEQDNKETRRAYQMKLAGIQYQTMRREGRLFHCLRRFLLAFHCSGQQ